MCVWLWSGAGGWMIMALTAMQVWSLSLSFSNVCEGRWRGGTSSLQTDIVIMQWRVLPHINTRHLHNEGPIRGCLWGVQVLSLVNSRELGFAPLLMKATLYFQRPVSQVVVTECSNSASGLTNGLSTSYRYRAENRPITQSTQICIFNTILSQWWCHSSLFTEKQVILSRMCL